MRFYKAHMADDKYGVEQAEVACRGALEEEKQPQEIEQLTQLMVEILQTQGKTQEAAEMVTGYSMGPSGIVSK